MVKPHIIKEIRSGNELKKRIRTDVLKSSICSDRTLKKLHLILEGVVENGTATNIKTDKYKIAGKTGTAQIANSNKGYVGVNGVNYQASFCGYFPADKPKYSCMVMVNSPSKSTYYANVVAGSVFRAISDEVFFRYLNPDGKEYKIQGHSNTRLPKVRTGNKKETDMLLDELEIRVNRDESESEWVVTDSKTENKIVYSDREIIDNLVPNVFGMGAKDAVFLMEKAGLRVSLNGAGRVTSQSIQPGVKVIRGSTVYLSLK